MAAPLGGRSRATLARVPGNARKIWPPAHARERWRLRMPQHREETTHFGFREVPVSEKSGLVGGVFRSVAGRYDLMNDLMSLGVHRLWKRYAAGLCATHKGNRVLDVAGGSGDMTALLASDVGPSGIVVLSDINEAMLDVGRSRLADRGTAGNVDFVRADAEQLPFADDHFDAVVIAFGLRNVTRIDRAAASMFRVLKPGGRLIV